MRITKLSTEEFAGLRMDEPLRFTEKVNVICGKNESGKSTLVNLIGALLFTDTHLVRKEKEDFANTYYPKAKKGSRLEAGNAHGRITLETEEGEYTLEKIWGDGERCTLRTPEATLRDPEKIGEALKGVLGYGQGVYREWLLSSQKNTDSALKNMLDPGQATEGKKELAAVVSRAFAQGDGLSMEEIEGAVRRKVEELGSCWDAERDAPERKTGGGRWQKGHGEVVKARYALEDAEETLRRLEALEQAADAAGADSRRKEEAAARAKDACGKFEKVVSRLENLKARQESLKRAEADLDRMTGARREWPALEEKRRKAETLQKELEDREKADLYARALPMQEKILELRGQLEGKKIPDREEIRTVRREQEEIRREENRLCAMNLRAEIRMAEGREVEIVSLRTGEPIRPENGLAEIPEAVRITVPGVMEMVLAPADTDPAEAEKTIRESRERIREILDRYGAKDLAELEKAKEDLDRAENERALAESRLEALLGGRAFAEIEKEAAGKEPRAAEEIRREIAAVCGTADAGRFVIQAEGKIGAYGQEYGSPERLDEAIRQKETERDSLRAEVARGEDVPEEYRQISDPARSLETLRADRDRTADALAEALGDKKAAERALDEFQQGLAEDPAERREEAEREFREKKALLGHWTHILAKFREVKEKQEEHPLVELTKRFADYLGMISGGQVTSEQPDRDRLSVEILSKGRALGYDLLSEGTRDTVSLAFRLAAVDYLFPQGGGVIVLDDPLTDMDPERAEEACALIRECAARHQVIFLTCREEYQDKLQGTVIKI